MTPSRYLILVAAFILRSAFFFQATAAMGQTAQTMLCVYENPLNGKTYSLPIHPEIVPSEDKETIQELLDGMQYRQILAMDIGASPPGIDPLKEDNHGFFVEGKMKPAIALTVCYRALQEGQGNATVRDNVRATLHVDISQLRLRSVRARDNGNYIAATVCHWLANYFTSFFKEGGVRAGHPVVSDGNRLTPRWIDSDPRNLAIFGIVFGFVRSKSVFKTCWQAAQQTPRLAWNLASGLMLVTGGLTLMLSCELGSQAYAAICHTPDACRYGWSLVQGHRRSLPPAREWVALTWNRVQSLVELLTASSDLDSEVAQMTRSWASMPRKQPSSLTSQKSGADESPQDDRMSDSILGPGGLGFCFLNDSGEYQEVYGAHGKTKLE